MAKFDITTVLGSTPNHVNGKHEGPSPSDAPNIFDALTTGGSPAFIALIDQLKEVDNGEDYKARFLLHGLATYTCGPGKGKHKKQLADTLAAQLNADRPATIKTYLLQTLQLIGDNNVAAAIGKHLLDDKLGDPAAAALVAIGKDGASELRTALPKATGRAQLTIVQSLGVLKDVASAKVIAAIADSAEGQAKVGALSALANMGDANSIDRLLKAADTAQGAARDKSTQACFVLAETLAATGRITDARRIYQHLSKNRKAADEAFMLEAAERGLKAIAGLKSAS